MDIRRIFIVLFLGSQLLIPLTYYLNRGDPYDAYDERFAWRMFSPIRMVRCDVTLSEDRGDGPHALQASREMALPWDNWMKRGHRRVILGFARHRCEAAQNAGEALAFYADVTCRLPGGEGDRLFSPSEDLCQRP